MRAEAENRRLHWDEQMGYGGTVSHHKQTVTNSYICHRYYYSGSATCWAAGCVLPSQGETTVTFRVDNMNGAIAFGVADAFARSTQKAPDPYPNVDGRGRKKDD